MPPRQPPPVGHTVRKKSHICSGNGCFSFSSTFFAVVSWSRAPTKSRRRGPGLPIWRNCWAPCLRIWRDLSGVMLPVVRPRASHCSMLLLLQSTLTCSTSSFLSSNSLDPCSCLPFRQREVNNAFLRSCRGRGRRDDKQSSMQLCRGVTTPI